MATFDRYKMFKEDGTFKCVPFIKIPVKDTDIYTYYRRGMTRMDLLSYQYYDDPNYGWLIMQANPDCGSLEFNIEDGTRLRIPFPLSTTLNQYQIDIDTYKRNYGLE